MLDIVQVGDVAYITIELFNEVALTGKTVNVSIEDATEHLFYNGADFSPGGYGVLGMTDLWTIVENNVHYAGQYEYQFTVPAKRVYRWKVSYTEGDFHVEIVGMIIGTDDSSDIDAILTAIGGGYVVTIVSPVSDDGNRLTLVQGDSYDDDNGRAIIITLTAHGYGNIAGGTTKLTLKDLSGSHFLSVSGTPADDGANATLTYELTKDQTKQLEPGTDRYGFDCQITLGGQTITPARGLVTVQEGYSP